MTIGGVGVKAGFKKGTTQLNKWQHFHNWKTQKLSKCTHMLHDMWMFLPSSKTQVYVPTFLAVKWYSRIPTLNKMYRGTSQFQMVVSKVLDAKPIQKLWILDVTQLINLPVLSLLQCTKQLHCGSGLQFAGTCNVVQQTGMKNLISCNLLQIYYCILLNCHKNTQRVKMENQPWDELSIKP